MKPGTQADDPAIANDPYLSTLESTQRQEVLRMEDQYISMLTEKYGMNEWFVKYQLNSNTGSYEPVFYNKGRKKKYF